MSCSTVVISSFYVKLRGNKSTMRRMNALKNALVLLGGSSAVMVHKQLKVYSTKINIMLNMIIKGKDILPQCEHYSDNLSEISGKCIGCILKPCTAYRYHFIVIKRQNASSI